MSSAKLDAKGWIACYRPLNAPKIRPQRIPPDQWRNAADPKAVAVAYAAACEAACRTLEAGAFVAADVHQALRLRAITEVQAEALLQGRAAPARTPGDALTLEAAALAHPSSGRDREKWRHLAYLSDFQAFAGIGYVNELTLDQVQRYIAHRQAKGDKWDTRRHRLVYVRRAARMGQALRGLPDPLTDFRLDRAEPRAPIAVFDLPTLAKAARKLQERGDYRALVALALGGFVGLRPSETFRARVEHLSGDVLTTGEKNAASKRQVPLPAIVAGWVRKQAGKRKAGPLLPTPDGGFNKHSFGKWLGDVLEETTGQDLPAKTLRKSFATWTVQGRIDPQHVEAYLGHQSAMLTKVTSRHYLGAWMANVLRPTAGQIDKAIRAAMAKAGTPKGTPARKVLAAR